jgi:two-component system, NarL family, invasion response regulator UvrY
MVRIGLCDDHPLVREGLRGVLSRHSDLKVELEAGTGRELLEAAPKVRLDVIVLDISLPDMSGLDVLKGLRAAGVKTGVLVLSMHPEDAWAVRVLKAGASGYLAKDSVPDELVTAVRRVALGRRYVSETLAERLAVDLGDEADRPPHELLSDREYQVLGMLAAGRGIKEIAGTLSLSAPTVATYRARLLAKLALTTTADLVRYALEHRLIP